MAENSIWVASAHNTWWWVTDMVHHANRVRQHKNLPLWCSGAWRSGYTLNLCPQYFFKRPSKGWTPCVI